jgi:hypothetical protein
MKPATYSVAGSSNTRCAVSSCSIAPLFMIAIRSASDSASVWSWVTKTAVKVQPTVQLVQLAAHLIAQPRIEVRQRLIKQHQPRPRHQPPGQRHALLLAARQLAGIAVQQTRPPRPVSSCPRPSLAASLGSACGRAAGIPHCAAPSCAATARRTGTPSRCRAFRVAGRCPGAASSASVPPMLIRPRSGDSSPARQRSVVVLPQPDGPSSTRNSPSSIVRFRLFAATVGGLPRNSLCKPSMRTSAMPSPPRVRGPGGQSWPGHWRVCPGSGR